MKKMTNLTGPYSKPREWLLKHLKRMRFKNQTIQDALEADWSGMNIEQAAYLTGTIWGRMRQIDDSLENNSEYFQLIVEEMASR